MVPLLPIIHPLPNRLPFATRMSLSNAQPNRHARVMVQGNRSQISLALDRLSNLVETVVDMDAVPVWWEGRCVLRGHLDVAGWLFRVVLAVEFSADGV